MRGLRDVEVEQTVQLTDRENSNLGRPAQGLLGENATGNIGPVGKGDKPRGQVGPPHRKPQGTLRSLELRAPYVLGRALCLRGQHTQP